VGELKIKDSTREKLGLITPEELAAALEVTPTTLQTWRVQDYGPRYVKLGKGVFYRYEEVQEWIASCLASGPPPLEVVADASPVEPAQSADEAVEEVVYGS
jgi:predicted DNA-binding transcriptional regulator AlpA